MSRKVKVPSMGNVTLTDNDYLSSGGEAEVYIKNSKAFKIYHNPDKMISDKKMQELSCLSGRSNIVIPNDKIYDSGNNPIGFTMPLLSNTEPLLKLFSNKFKRKSGLADRDVNDLINKIQDTVQFIHSNNILVVDLNELNLLISENFDDVYFIDTDSYQTPSARATAIMASIRDPLVKKNAWHEGSDWFSFAILAFQIWIGTHPYKGAHPKYKMKEWMKRMQDGVSVFDADATLPRMCNEFSIIPPSHLQWMKAVFQNGERSKPPKMGEISVIISTQQNIVIVSESFDLKLVFSFEKEILDCYDVMGVKHLVSNDGIYKGNAKLPIDTKSAKKVVFSSGTGFSPVVAKLENEMLGFYNLSGKMFAEISATDMTTRNSIVYSLYGDQVYENSFRTRNGKDLHEFRVVCNVMKNSSRVFDGVIMQTMLKKQFAVVPYEKGKCSIVHLEELDSSRVIDAKCERNVMIVMVEKEGLYNRHVFTFDSDYKTYEHRIELNVVMTDINFTVLPNGVTVLATESEVVIFKGTMEKHIPNAPFSSENKLFNLSGLVHYIDGKEIIQASVKR